MTASKPSTEVLPSDNGEWLQITPGERFKIRTSVEETDGAFAMLEMVANPQNGVPMHIHKNEVEHFIVLERHTAHRHWGEDTGRSSRDGSHRQKGRSSCLVQSVGHSPSNAARFFTWAYRATV